MTCVWCGEPMADTVAGMAIQTNMAAMHTECAYRAVAGSVAHLEKRCSCYVPGSEEGDPPGMTKREAASAAWAGRREID